MVRLRWALLLLACSASAAQGPELEKWPECQQQGQVLRHNGLNGIFLDVREVGAQEGCWQDNCEKSDKFVCPSPAQCATACAFIEGCKFWTFEPSVPKCYLRSSDAGREANPQFVSGTVLCRPPDDSEGGAAGAGPSPRLSSLPFAQAALWAAELPAIRPCDGGIAATGCSNPFAAMGVWRYAVNNLRMAVQYVPEAERAQLANVAQYVQQVSNDVALFYQMPTGETFQVAVSNCMTLFSGLKSWLQAAPASEVPMPGPHLGGSPHLPQPGPSVPVARTLAEARVRLADGNEMPLVGFGTWQLLGQQVYDATLAALAAGYRHIDTAQAYMNEREVGLAIRESGVPRDELFLATKISDPGEFANLRPRLEAQLAALGTSYIDLYMLHSPGDRPSQEAAWRTMEDLHAEGKVRSLGVSNFGKGELEELLAFARVKPVYLQNKLSVYCPGEQQLGDESILAFARKHNIQVVGYSILNPWPLMLSPMEDPHVASIARRLGRSPAQVLHRWALQLGVAVIPKSGSPSRIEENARLFDFELSELDMRLLNGLVTLSESVAGRPSPGWADDAYGLAAAAEGAPAAL